MRHYRKTSRRKSTGGKKTKSRRRRMGATSALKFNATSPAVKWGSVLLGFLKPDLLPISKLVGDKVDSKIVAGGETAIGFLLAMRKGKKSLPEVIAGGYLMGAGIKKALQAFGIMTGIGPYGRVPVVGSRPRINGPYGNMPVISGYSPNNAMNGYSPSGTISDGKVMAGLGDRSSGYTNPDKASNYMN